MNFQPTPQHPFSNNHPLNIDPRLAHKKTNKTTKKYLLELPRFLSQQNKMPKKKLLSNNYQVQLQDLQGQKEGGARKLSKLSLKYSRTQKNETPPKLKFDGKSTKAEKLKLTELMSKGRVTQALKQQKDRRSSVMTQTDYVIPNTRYQKLNLLQDSPQLKYNLNKIKYNLGQQKRNEERAKKFIEFVETEEIYNENAEIQLDRLAKVITQESASFKLRQAISKIQAKNQNLAAQFVNKEDQASNPSNKGHQRTFSLINKSTAKCEKLQKQQIQHLVFLEEIFKKTISQPNNLDFAEAYIVLDKLKLEKAINKCLEQKYHPFYKTHLVYCRIAFYLCAHFTLVSINANILLEIFAKLGQTQTLLMKILGVGQEKGRQKCYSQINVIHNLLPVKHESYNKANIFEKNNQAVREMIEAIIGSKNFPCFQLFQSWLLSPSQNESLEFIADLDKSLKWQILKMPTYPFLPKCSTRHLHHLVLDLDQTLIHFDPEQGTFHIRPYAEEFLKKLSAYFEITIFTAATQEYADDIIKNIDEECNVKHRLYRNHLTFLKGSPLKDISLLGRSMKSTIIVDNLKSNFRLQMDNGIEIKPWMGKGEDKVLQKLEFLLLKIVNEFPQDLRKGLKVYRGFIDRQIRQKVNVKPKLHNKQ